MGFEMLGIIAIFGFIGYLCGKAFPSIKTYLLAFCLVLGVILSMVYFIRKLIAEEKDK